MCGSFKFGSILPIRFWSLSAIHSIGVTNRVEPSTATESHFGDQFAAQLPGITTVTAAFAHSPMGERSFNQIRGSKESGEPLLGVAVFLMNWIERAFLQLFSKTLARIRELRI